jgi:hypothetical protein
MSVVHTAGTFGIIGWINDGEGIHGYRPYQSPKYSYRIEGRAKVAFSLGRVLRLKQQRHLDV